MEENLIKKYIYIYVSSVQSFSHVQLFVTPWSTGFPVHHQIPEIIQTHVHWVGDAIQSSHPLLSPSPPAFSLSQHQGHFQWVNSSHQVAKVLEFSFSISSSNEYSGSISFTIDWFDLLAIKDWLQLIFLQSRRLSIVFSNTIVQKHQFFGAQLSLWSNSHIHTWPLKKP